LHEAGLLEKPVLCVIGNPLAAKQYFEALEAAPSARQETRDAYRCGVADDGLLLPDMNRIPVDFLLRSTSDPHIKRAQELYHLAQYASGILDIHSARGTMLCVTDHNQDRYLKHVPIRAVLTELAEAIAANASKTAQVKTFKTIVSALSNIECQVGIEAGRHEDPDAPGNASQFTHAILYNIAATKVSPEKTKDDGKFTRYAVKPRITYADLLGAQDVEPDDSVLMAKALRGDADIPERCDRVIVCDKEGNYVVQTVLQYIITPKGKLAYGVYQYEEMEPIKEGQVVAVAVPSGVELCAPRDFSGIFVSKSRTLYSKDTAVGPWPLSQAELASTKFCYPCDISEMKISF
jgi:hypothetical protein